MTQQEFLDAIRALLKEYGGYTLEGPDWAGDVILRRDLNGEEKTPPRREPFCSSASSNHGARH